MGLLSTLVSHPIVRWLGRQRPPREFPLSDFERIRYELKPCDVLLVEGRSRVSDVIRMTTQSPWSHASLYIGRLHDIEDPEVRAAIQTYARPLANEQLIIESQLETGTVVRPLSVYRDDHLRICRPKGLGMNDGQAIIAYAVSRLGTGYNVRQILDLARFLFPWSILPRRWRSSLFRHNAGDATHTVCSTMIAEAFAAVQFPILPLVTRGQGDDLELFRRNPKLCVPSDFDYSPYFEIIKYPFLDFSMHSSYRLLPWSRGGALDIGSREDPLRADVPGGAGSRSQSAQKASKPQDERPADASDGAGDEAPDPVRREG